MKTELLNAVNLTHPAPAKPPPGSAAAPSFRLETDPEGVAWLTFDTPGSAANVWNEATLAEFDSHVRAVGEDKTVRALVVRSAKDKITVAGADLKAVRHVPVKRLETLIALGQETFTRLSKLEIPTVALIHGACLGGGLEMALACKVRIASDSEATRLGLPETQIGLVPAWGGSTRLPRLLGLPKALELIVSGKQLRAREALKAGLVDRVVPREHLEKAAREALARPQARPALPLAKRVWSWPGARHFVARKVRAMLMQKTRGLYQAPLRAVEVAAGAAGRDEAGGLELERHAILDLALTPETGRLIDLFFKNEEASKKPWPRGVALNIHDVAVIGAGVMGVGIAHWVASKGNRVLLQDISTESLASGMKRVNALLQEGRKRRVLGGKEVRDTLDRITPDHTRAALSHHPLVIEAATEDMGLKKKIFADLAARTHPDTLLATNTSALSVEELAATVPHPERVIGLHFFNPVHRMPLVEIITTRHTTDDVVATAVAFVQRLGKVPVVVKDSPGFIVNRILMPYLMEAVRLHQAGKPAELIDEAMLEFGMPMGPMRLLDEIGLDVAAHVGLTLTAAYPERLAKVDVLDQMVAAGKLGKKSGEGFYKYPAGPEKKVLWSQDEAREMEATQQRLALLISNEAARCAAEGIARQEGDIDLAMILGTGYPAFRGGPLEWLRGFGEDAAAMELRHLATTTPQPNAFSPEPLFRPLAAAPVKTTAGT